MRILPDVVTIAIDEHIPKLKEHGIITIKGSRKSGTWEVHLEKLNADIFLHGIHKILRSLPTRNRPENQVALTNRIIALIGSLTGDAALGDVALPANTEMLFDIIYLQLTGRVI